MIYIYIIWSILIALEIWRNWYLIERLKRRPTYWMSTVGRILVGFIFWFASPFIHPGLSWWQWWGEIAMMVFTFGYFFDYGLNIARGIRPVWYLNPKGSILDQLQCKYPNSFAWFWWKLFLMMTGISMMEYGLDAIWNGV